MSKNIEKINRWFEKRAGDIIRWRWVIFALTFAFIGLSVIGIQQLYIDSSNESFFIEDDPMMVTKRNFEDVFGNEEFIYILIEAEDVFAPEVLKFIRALGEDLKENLPFAREVISLASVEYVEASEEAILVHDLVGKDVPTEPAAIESIRQKALSKPAYIDKIVSSDSKMAGILVFFDPIPPSQKGASDLRKTIAPAFKKIMANPTYQEYTIHAAGVPIVDYELDALIIEELIKFGLLSLIVAITLLIFLFRSVTGMSAPASVLAATAIIILGVQGFLEIPLNMMSNILPVVIMVVSISYSVHVMSFFRQHFAVTGRRHDSLSFALKHAGWPCLFTAITTAAGFASFMVVPIKPLKEVGLLISFGVLLAYVMVIIIVPAMLSFGKDHLPEGERGSVKGDGMLQTFLLWLAGLVERRPLPIGIIFLAVIIVFGFSITRLKIDSDFVSALGKNIPIVQDILYVGDRMGGLYSYEILIDTGEADGIKDPEILKAVDKLQAFCEQYPAISISMSITDIVKDTEQVLNGGDTAFYRIPETPGKIAQGLLLYEMSGGEFLEEWVDYEYRRLRVSAQATYTSISENERQFREIEAYAAEIFPDGTRVSLTGAIPLMIRMASYVTTGQIRSILVAFAVIMIMMMVVFGSIKTGLIAMIPNLLPVVVVLGYMGLTGIPLDFMTMMIAAIVMGIAVDDTIHYINHFRLEFYRTGSYSEANRHTFRYVGRAITFTTIVLVAGFSIIGLSRITSLRNFSLFSAVAILTALLADYFVTPVMIMTFKPFGKNFGGKQHEKLP